MKQRHTVRLLAGYNLQTNRIKVSPKKKKNLSISIRVRRHKTERNRVLTFYTPRNKNKQTKAKHIS